MPSWLQAVLGIGSVATPLILGAMGNSNSKNQANAILAAQQQANALAAGQYAQNRQDMLPWIQAGQGSVNQLAYMLGIPTGSNMNALLAGNPQYSMTANQAQSTPSQQGLGRTNIGYDNNDAKLRPTPSSAFYSQTSPRFDTVGEMGDADPPPLRTASSFVYDIKRPMGGWDTQNKYMGSPNGSPNLSADGSPANAMMGYSGGTNNGFGSLMHDFDINDFYNNVDPGYAFRLSEGQKALERGAAARGNALGGAAIKEAQRFGQDYGSNEFLNAYNRYQNNRSQKYNMLAGLSQTGQIGQGQINTLGAQYANNAGNNLLLATGAANDARQSGYNSLAGGVGNATNNLIKYFTQRYPGRV
jgi:hypothetical protein